MKTIKGKWMSLRDESVNHFVPAGWDYSICGLQRNYSEAAIKRGRRARSKPDCKSCLRGIKAQEKRV